MDFTINIRKTKGAAVKRMGDVNGWRTNTDDGFQEIRKRNSASQIAWDDGDVELQDNTAKTFMLDIGRFYAVHYKAQMVVKKNNLILAGKDFSITKLGRWKIAKISA